MKPPIQYFGAKIAIAEKIVSLMPEHRGYIEPFAGSLSVLLAKSPAKIEVANDLDHRLMAFWRVCRDRPDELARVAELTPHSREELEIAMRLDDLDTQDDLERARRVWVLLTQGRSRLLKRTGWRFYADPRGTSSAFQQYMGAYRSRIVPAAERLRDVSLECRPALEVIAQYGAFADNLLYVDPPYLGTVRRGGRYTVEMSGVAEHVELLEALRDVKASVILSGYESDLYDEHLTGWSRVALAARTQGADRTEVVWMNYTPNGVLDFDALATDRGAA